MRVVTVILLVFHIQVSRSVECFACLDRKILDKSHLIPEINFKQQRKLPSCDQDSASTKECFVGCYEVEVLQLDSDGSRAFLRTCASDDFISKMRPNGTNSLPLREAEGVAITSYMCTLDKCNNKYGSSEKGFFHQHRFTLLAVGFLVAAVLLCGVGLLMRTRRSSNNRRNLV